MDGVLSRQFWIYEAIFPFGIGLWDLTPKTCRLEWTARKLCSVRFSPSESAS